VARLRGHALMEWKAIKRVTGVGPAHAMREPGKTWCGRVDETRGNRFSEVWITVPEPESGKKCIHCKAALGRGNRG